MQLIDRRVLVPKGIPVGYGGASFGHVYLSNAGSTRQMANGCVAGSRWIWWSLPDHSAALSCIRSSRRIEPVPAKVWISGVSCMVPVCGVTGSMEMATITILSLTADDFAKHSM